MVTGVAAVTTEVVTAAVAEAAPAGTVMALVGNAGFEPDTCTAAPPAGATSVRLTVTLTAFPPVTNTGRSRYRLQGSRWNGLQGYRSARALRAVRQLGNHVDGLRGGDGRRSRIQTARADRARR